MIASSFEDLTQSLRVFLEAWFKFPQLVTVDRPEACGNIDNSFNSILNSFHSLYDSIKVEIGSHPINWYATPELCFVLAFRNARHHNNANKIRGIYTYHSRVPTSPTETEEYLLVDFALREEEARVMDYYFSWADYYTLLEQPSEESKLRAGTKDLIYDYLDGHAIEGYIKDRGMGRNKVFINAIPLIVNAGIAIYPHIKDHIDTSLSTESSHFKNHFRDVLPADTGKHLLSWMSLNLPE